jgi:hypothetical protein
VDLLESLIRLRRQGVEGIPRTALGASAVSPALLAFNKLAMQGTQGGTQEFAKRMREVLVQFNTSQVNPR